MKYKIVHGDCIETMQQICGDESIDAVVCDPPAGIAFMGKAWDKDKGGCRQWIAWMTDVARECLRILKPGGHALVWALPRTSHWTGTAWEGAGFDVRDCVFHHFGSGFPKSRDISKALDQEANVEREVVGVNQYAARRLNSQEKAGVFDNKGPNLCGPDSCKVTTPVTEAAKKFDGYGTNLKPATECWWLLRKPLSEKTVAKNVLKHGTGGINIEGCRVSGSHTGAALREGEESAECRYTNEGSTNFAATPGPRGGAPQGRWPANLILSHHEDCVCRGNKSITPLEGHRPNPIGKQSDGNIVFTKKKVGDQKISYTNEKGQEEVEDWVCHEDCPVRMLDEQSGVLKSGGGTKTTGGKKESVTGWKELRVEGYLCGPDKGGASRFFYQAKSAKRERNFGMPEGTKNTHPTVKPLALMRYLIKLITPPGGVIIDPFLGSGSTMLAAMLEDVDCIGCEKEVEYYAINKQRCDYAYEHLDELRAIVDKTKKPKAKKKKAKPE